MMNAAPIPNMLPHDDDNDAVQDEDVPFYDVKNDEEKAEERRRQETTSTGLLPSISLPVNVKLGAQDNEHEEEHHDFQLQQDIYTLLFTAPFSLTSHAFLYSVFIFLFQSAVISLTLADLLKDGTSDNILAIPPAVDPVVSVAQVFALFIAVLTQDDLTTTLYLCSVGYDPHQLPPTASRGKWIFSIVIRFMVGMSIIVLCFVFIVQSTSVIDLFKDFAAIFFVVDIDDAAFALAQRGFVSDALREATCALKDIHFVERDDTVAIQAGNGKKAPRIIRWLMRWHLRGRRIFLIVVVGTLVGIWGWLFSRQQNGDFMPRTIQVQFGDETYGQLQYAFFSGTYEMGNERLGRRPVYYERGEVSAKTSGKFFYCTEEEAWVFSIAGLTTDKDDSDDCRWLFRSPTTNGYDLSAVSSSGWRAWTGRIQPANDFQLGNSACRDSSDCNYHGSCESDGRCKCNPGWLGSNCGFEDVICDSLIFYIEDVPIQEFFLLQDETGEPVVVYDRPVYYGEDPALNEEGLIAIMYTGRRWFITTWGEVTLEELRSRLAQPFFHAHWSQLFDKNTLEFSDPTASLLPVGGQVKWDSVAASRAKGDFGTFGFWKDIEHAFLHCKNVDCTVQLVCGLHGVCQNGTCICEEGRSGHFCHFPFYPGIADNGVNDNAEL